MALAVISGCSRDSGNPVDETGCRERGTGLIGFGELITRFSGQPTEILEEQFLEGVVVSSDRDGNIFGSIYLQDRAVQPRFGLEIRTDLTETHAVYPPGTWIRVRLQGLFLGRQGGGYALGTVRTIFGNQVLDRIPARATLDHLLPSCNAPVAPEPYSLRAENLDTVFLHTLVRIADVEINEGYTGDRFAGSGVETVIPLSGCSGGQLGMVNSGYSDFQADPLPSGTGSATGILTGSAGDYRLLLRFAGDLALSGPSCGELYPPERSDALLISEIADPENEPGARFLELYNAGEKTLDLNGWSLLRYTNDNAEPAKPADLSGFRLGPSETLVLSANPEVFEALYGRLPDLVLSSNGPADSNGDDNLVLMDPFGEVTDTFGIPGEDGSGTSHEFEDGGAFRRAGIRKGSPAFNPAEWVIFNDTGEAGTEFRPLSAPADFTPGTHEPNAGKSYNQAMGKGSSGPGWRRGN